MFVGLSSRNKLFDKQVTEELNVAFKAIDNKVSSMQSSKVYEEVNPIVVEIDGVMSNLSQKFGNEIVVLVQVSATATSFKLPIPPFVAFETVAASTDGFVRVAVDIDGTVTVDTHTNDIWIYFNYIAI